MAFDLLTGYGDPLTTHAASWRVLLETRALLERHPAIVEDAQWNELQSLGIDLAGHAATLLATVHANTSAVRMHVDRLAQGSEAWRVPLHARASEQAQAIFADAHVAALALGSRVESLAAFHAARTAEDEEDDLVLDEEAVQLVTSLGGELERLADEGLAALHDAMCGASSPGELQHVAQRILGRAQPRNLLAGQLLGRVAQLGVPPGLRDALGPAALRLAEVSSRLRLLLTYAAYVRVQSHTLGASRWLEEERRAAQRPHASQVPTGVAVELDALARVPEGTLVEVEGAILGLSIVDDPTPPSSSSIMTLGAYESTLTVRLRAPMRDLQANGIGVGACCKVRGFVRRAGAWLTAGETGLDIDRVSLTELRTQSWVDDVTYRMRPFFTLYVDELNLHATPSGVL